MGITVRNIDYSTFIDTQSSKIRLLARGDFPELDNHTHEWHRFLVERGHELERQLQIERSEHEFEKAMSKILGYLNSEYDPIFLAALKRSLVDIAVYYDSIQTIKPEQKEAIPNPTDFDSLTTIEPPSLQKHWFIAGLDLFAKGTEIAYRNARNAVISGITTATYAFTAAVFIDVALLHQDTPETSYTGQFLAHYTQSTP